MLQKEIQECDIIILIIFILPFITGVLEGCKGKMITLVKVLISCRYLFQVTKMKKVRNILKRNKEVVKSS